jgi:2-oxoisovalerate dehydrogenase E1 component
MKLREQHFPLLHKALLIREFEAALLRLFSAGKLNGTVHTCIGQELSAISVADSLRPTDQIFSNHRCHGHYLAFTGDVEGLMAELMGKGCGVCGGTGGSQHLCRGNFYSNGIQAGMVPVAAGHAMANKMRGNGAIAAAFIGDGTLGEGVVYETMNIASLWELPLLITCENNYYAQSTPVASALAGSIPDRAKAFGMRVLHSTTWNLDELLENAQAAADYVRTRQKPCFHLIETYRLQAHSKGDDDRNPVEIENYQNRDLVNIWSEQFPDRYQEALNGHKERLNKLIASLDACAEPALETYWAPSAEASVSRWIPHTNTTQKIVTALNDFFSQTLAQDAEAVFLGEDVQSPYGGAFKVARGLSDAFPLQVFTTPISEAAIVGIANGLALSGMRPYVEIMFGDFVTLAMDQIVNHASKFHHMYNKQVACPVVLRTPMGGRRGYGPTHSQTLDKFLVGIDNVTTVALHTLLDPAEVYREVHGREHPVIVLENKVDYGKFILPGCEPPFVMEKSTDRFPLVRIRPRATPANVTIIAHGPMVDIVASILRPMVGECDVAPELVALTQLSPITGLALLKECVEASGRALVVEEGSSGFSVGSELVASLVECVSPGCRFHRLGALPVPIPSAKGMEQMVLPGKDRIFEAVRTLCHGCSR